MISKDRPNFILHRLVAPSNQNHAVHYFGQDGQLCVLLLRVFAPVKSPSPCVSHLWTKGSGSGCQDRITSVVWTSVKYHSSECLRILSIGPLINLNSSDIRTMQYATKNHGSMYLGGNKTNKLRYTRFDIYPDHLKWLFYRCIVSFVQNQLMKQRLHRPNGLNYYEEQPAWIDFISSIWVGWSIRTDMLKRVPYWLKSYIPRIRQPMEVASGRSINKFRASLRLISI